MGLQPYPAGATSQLPQTLPPLPPPVPHPSVQMHTLLCLHPGTQDAPAQLLHPTLPSLPWEQAAHRGPCSPRKSQSLMLSLPGTACTACSDTLHVYLRPTWNPTGAHSPDQPRANTSEFLDMKGGPIRGSVFRGIWLCAAARDGRQTQWTRFPRAVWVKLFQITSLALKLAPFLLPQ